ncbi:MAG: diversity-generating retroelement protein bAvd family protein [Balneola sp.]|nr:diversity-generating retroelement protein bAvd family protein [Balneola sp.]|tara:strand:- start:33805 stop:34152 length:348 start_codon:yes stop_codon:yes gene_type:complete
MKNFKKLIVWQRSMQLASETNKIVSKLPQEERFTYRDQIIRSSISIPSNIAEGSSRDSRKDFKRFLRISPGSCFELETQLLLLGQNEIVAPGLLKIAAGYNDEVQKMLHTLLKKT